MSAKLRCKFGDGIEQNYRYATVAEARRALERALNDHRAQSHAVMEQPRGNEEPLYIITRGDGRVMRTYQLIPAFSAVS